MKNICLLSGDQEFSTAFIVCLTGKIVNFITYNWSTRLPPFPYFLILAILSPIISAVHNFFISRGYGRKDVVILFIVSPRFFISSIHQFDQLFHSFLSNVRFCINFYGCHRVEKWLDALCPVPVYWRSFSRNHLMWVCFWWWFYSVKAKICYPHS